MAVTSVLGPDIDVAFELSTTQLDTGLSLPENLEAGVMSRGNEGVENDPRFRVTSCCDGLILAESLPFAAQGWHLPERLAHGRRWQSGEVVAFILRRGSRRYFCAR